MIKPIACRPMVSSSANTTPILGNRPAVQHPHSAKASLGLHSSTTDLRPAKSSVAMQRFSWSKVDDASAAGGQRNPVTRKFEFQPHPPHSLPPQAPHRDGRVADLSRRFGGSLCSVAAPPNSPIQPQQHPQQQQQPRQPPAYRPPPSRISGKYFQTISAFSLQVPAGSTGLLRHFLVNFNFSYTNR